MIDSMLGMAGSVAGQYFGDNLNRRNMQRQHRYNEKLQDNQYANQKGLNSQAADLAYKQWNRTNYSAQMGHMRQAGLNPALMYGMSGGGGTTAQTGSGGSASGGSAGLPTTPFMDIAGSIAKISQALLNEQKGKTEETVQTLNQGLKSRIDKEIEGLISNNKITASNAKVIDRRNEAEVKSAEEQLKIQIEELSQMKDRSKIESKMREMWENNINPNDPTIMRIFGEMLQDPKMQKAIKDITVLLGDNLTDLIEYINLIKKFSGELVDPENWGFGN